MEEHEGEALNVTLEGSPLKGGFKGALKGRGGGLEGGEEGEGRGTKVKP